MTLRAEERFVLTRIVESLGGANSVSSNEGEDPPDAYVTVGDTRCLLEITQLSQLVIGKNGAIESRLTQDIFGLRLLNELDSEFRESVPQDKSLLVHLKIPVAKPAKFKAQLRKVVAEIVASDEYPESWKEVTMEGAKAGILTISRDATERKCVTGFVENANSSADILANARTILDNRICIKNEICSSLPFQGPKWLGLLNQYWLADVDTYRAALKRSEVTHDFEKIFFVQDTGEVHVLHSET